jgi:hypothetical protein
MRHTQVRFFAETNLWSSSSHESIAIMLPEEISAGTSDFSSQSPDKFTATD